MSLLVLVVSIGIFATACGNSVKTGENTDKGIWGGNNKDGKAEQSLSVGLESLDGVFNPFYGSNGGDVLIVSSVFDYVCEMNDNGEPADRGGSVAFEEIQSEDGQKQYLYTVTVKKDMYFTDGEEVTIDDVTKVSDMKPTKVGYDFVGWYLTSAAAAAQGAEPEPASLENRPRFTPFINTAPKPPAAT